MAKIIVGVPDEAQRKRLEDIFRALAGNNQAAQLRVAKDVRQLWSFKKRAAGLALTNQESVDRKIGIPKLRSVKKRLEDLADDLEQFAPNLSAAWMDPALKKDPGAFADADILRALAAKADAAIARFKARRKNVKWDLQQVSRWTARVYEDYTGRTPSLSSRQMPKDGLSTKAVTEGPNQDFLNAVLTELQIKGSAPTAIRTRRREVRKAQKRVK